MGRLVSICTACIVFVSVFVTLFVAGMQPDVTAQDDAAAMAAHPLVGG